MIGTIIVFILIPIVALFINAVEEYNKGIPFDESYKDVGIPVITLTNNGKQFNFLVDTGANYCIINEPHLKEFEYKELKGEGTIFGMEGNVQKTNFVQASLYYEKDEFVASFQVLDISGALDRINKQHGITVHGILGSEFLEENRSKINFIEHEVTYEQIKN